MTSLKRKSERTNVTVLEQYSSNWWRWNTAQERLSDGFAGGSRRTEEHFDGLKLAVSRLRAGVTATLQEQASGFEIHTNHAGRASSDKFITEIQSSHVFRVIKRRIRVIVVVSRQRIGAVAFASTLSAVNAKKTTH